MSEKQPVIPNLLVRATKFIQERQEIIDGRSMFGESEGTDSIKITLYGKLADVLSRALVLSSPNDPFYGLNIGEEDQGFNNYQSVDPDTLPLDSFDDLIKIDMVGLRTRLMEARKKKDIGGLKTIVDEIVEVRNIIENRTTYQNYIARRIERNNTNVTSSLDRAASRYTPESRESRLISFIRKEQEVLNFIPEDFESDILNIPGIGIDYVLNCARLERVANGLSEGQTNIAETYLVDQRTIAEQRRDEELGYTTY